MSPLIFQLPKEATRIVGSIKAKLNYQIPVQAVKYDSCTKEYGFKLTGFVCLASILSFFLTISIC